MGKSLDNPQLAFAKIAEQFSSGQPVPFPATPVLKQLPLHDASRQSLWHSSSAEAAQRKTGA
jgi:hypothetical protein